MPSGMIPLPSWLCWVFECTRTLYEIAQWTRFAAFVRCHDRMAIKSRVMTMTVVVVVTGGRGHTKHNVGSWAQCAAWCSGTHKGLIPSGLGGGGEAAFPIHSLHPVGTEPKTHTGPQTTRSQQLMSRGIKICCVLILQVNSVEDLLKPITV
jgi:hypothetical protein